MVLAITAISCKKNTENVTADDTVLKVKKTASAKKFACRMKLAEVNGPKTEANGYAQYRWPNGSTVKVRFIGGSPYVRGKVTQYAKAWEAYANITFSFVADNAPADIKIAFEDDGSWSYIGTGSRDQSVSMNFGWFDENTDESDFRGTTLHEFGHALGLNHEQSHPDANIPWNKQAVYDDLGGAPNYWSKETVDYNVFSVESRQGLSYNAYDQASIMHYPVYASWTTNNIAIAPNNTTLSAGDIAYMKTYYPGRN